jgi:hypothetical protein
MNEGKWSGLYHGPNAACSTNRACSIRPIMEMQSVLVTANRDSSSELFVERNVYCTRAASWNNGEENVNLEIQLDGEVLMAGVRPAVYLPPLIVRIIGTRMPLV